MQLLTILIRLIPVIIKAIKMQMTCCHLQTLKMKKAKKCLLMIVNLVQITMRMIIFKVLTMEGMEVLEIHRLMELVGIKKLILRLLNCKTKLDFLNTDVRLV